MMGVTVGDLLVKLVQDRDAALASPDRAEQQQKAVDVLRDSMFMVHKILGPDLLAAALGVVDETDRVAVLEAVAQRSAIFACVFGKMPDDAASPWKVVEEAIAVARGDAPLMFARSDQRKVKHRIIRAKFQALQWDAYLDGRGMAPGERHDLIAEAFGYDWASIEKWKRDIRPVLDEDTVSYQLAVARLAGSRGEPRWEMLGSTDWQAALARDGQRYLATVRRNIGNR